MRRSPGSGYRPDIDAKEFKETLNEVLGAYTQAMLITLAESGIGMLEAAQPRVPIYAGGPLGKASTGDLRRSGHVTVTVDGVQNEIARGNEDGSVTANDSRLARAMTRPSRYISVEIVYDDPKAMWAHENLLPYEARGSKPPYTYAARTPGTGPKFLETAFYEVAPTVEGQFKEAGDIIDKEVTAAVAGNRPSAITRAQHKVYDKLQTRNKRFGRFRGK